MAPSPAQPATLWTGPNITFTQFDPNPTDLLVSNAVSIARASQYPLYNGVTETSCNLSTSPEDTLWAFNPNNPVSLNNCTNFSYFSFCSLRNGDLAAQILNQPMVLQLVGEQIYISIEFTAWGQHGAGGFTYIRSTPAAATPTVSLTNPVAGEVYAAPANISLSASASVSGGTVTNVTFFANSSALGTATNAPFSIIASNVAAGSYSLTAVATAGGISATSSVVHVSVINAVPVSLSASTVANGVFSFEYTANPGLRYVVAESSNLSTWLPISTNTASSSPVLFTNSVSGGRAFFQVGRVPNP